MKVLVLSGAGISAESGIPTFRGLDGLWEGHRVEDVATPGAFERDPELVRQDRLVVVDSIDLAEPKTSALVGKLAELGFEKGLIVTNEPNENVYLASRNIPGVYMIDVAGLDPVSLVASDKVVVTVEAVEKIQEWLG